MTPLTTIDRPAPQTLAQHGRRHRRSAPTITGRPSAPPPPPAAAAIQGLAMLAFEVVEGHRPIAQLGRLISPEALTRLRLQRAGRAERRSLFRDQRRVVPTPGPPHLSTPEPGTLECAVVLLADPKSSAVAMRLEFDGERWQATELTVL